MARKFAKEIAASGRDAELNFPTLHLGWLFRFAVFVRDGKGSPVPLSFRAFMKREGSHRTMVKAVDAIEHLARRLMVTRAVLDAQGQHVSFTESYMDALQEKTKRIGHITPHGHAWAEFGDYVGDLLELAIQTEDAEELRKFIAEARDVMRRYREVEARHASRQKE